MMARTLLLAAAVIGALGVLGPYLDGIHIDDHSAEVDQARNIEDTQRAAQARKRFEDAAQRICGPQSVWREVSQNVIRCVSKRGIVGRATWPVL